MGDHSHERKWKPCATPRNGPITHRRLPSRNSGVQPLVRFGGKIKATGSLATHMDSIQALPPNLAPQTAPGVWETVLKQLPPAKNALNAGAGRGGMSLLLHQRGIDVTSIDLHPEHFAAPGLVCQKQDLLRPLEFPDASFDLVLA